jgi:gas vesicle protein
MRKRSSNVAVGAALVGVAGYVIGLLTAPKSGKETRKDIQTAAIKAKKEAEARLKDLHKELDDVLETGKTKAKDFTADRREQYDQALDRARAAKAKARELLSAIHEGDAEDKDLKNAIDEVAQAIAHVKTFLKK